MGTDFQCQKCGECCRSRFYRDPGAAGLHVYVPMYESDKDRISSYLKITVDQLEEKYGIIGGCLVITGRECPFLIDNICSIHKVKPRFCAITDGCKNGKK